MNGIIEQRDGVAKDTAENFGDYQRKCRGHGPGQDGGSHDRMRMAVMIVVVSTMRVIMGMNRSRRMSVGVRLIVDVHC